MSKVTQKKIQIKEEIEKNYPEPSTQMSFYQEYWKVKPAETVILFEEPIISSEEVKQI